MTGKQNMVIQTWVFGNTSPSGQDGVAWAGCILGSEQLKSWTTYKKHQFSRQWTSDNEGQ